MDLDKGYVGSLLEEKDVQVRRTREGAGGD